MKKIRFINVRIPLGVPLDDGCGDGLHMIGAHWEDGCGVDDEYDIDLIQKGDGGRDDT